MDRSGVQRLIPIILVLIIVVLAVAALVSVGRTLFSGSPQPSAAPVVNTAKKALISTTADRSVRMTVRGPIIADENFHSYTITAAPDARNMTTYVGYLGQQVGTEQLSNNTQAYEQFVYALDQANLMAGSPLTGGADDIRGICATGTVTQFEVLLGTSTIQRLWTSTCKIAAGSLKANATQVSRLFQVQIPDFSKLLGKINLPS